MIDPKRAEQIIAAKKWRKSSKLMNVEFDPLIWAYINAKEAAAYLRGPNSGGKSYAQAFFIAQVALGRYHPCYTGWKPTIPANDTFQVIIWVLSKSSQVLRDALQTALLGDVAGGRLGVDCLIPKESIINVQAGRGIGGAVDYCIIRRDDGSTAKISFKSYEQGREMLQGERVTLVACDEMFDDEGMLSELLARGAGVGGIFRLSATERLQQSAVAEWFYQGQHGTDRKIYGFGMDDISRISSEEKARIKASYPPNEVDARYHGLPFRGGGGVWAVPLTNILADVDPANFEPFYRYLISLDLSHFGTSASASNFAALFWAINPYTNDCIIFHEILMKGTSADHAAALLAANGAGIPIAWPHDGMQGQADGNTIIKQYRVFKDLRILPHHATFGPGNRGGYNMESGISLANELMHRGKIKISRSLRNFQKQFSGYERDEKTGKPIAKNDDLMSAFRVGVMMLRAARVPDEFQGHARPRVSNYLDDPNGKWDIFTGEAIQPRPLGEVR